MRSFFVSVEPRKLEFPVLWKEIFMFEATSFVARDSSLFQFLDGLADATNILLLVWLLAVLIIGTKRQKFGGQHWLAVVLAIASVYVVKTLDSKLHLWESLNLNYSTHSALAAAAVASLFLLDRPRKFIAIAVFVAYGVLQMLLGFHSLFDIGSTLVAVLPLIWLCLRLAMPNRELTEEIKSD